MTKNYIEVLKYFKNEKNVIYLKTEDRIHCLLITLSNNLGTFNKETIL